MRDWFAAIAAKHRTTAEVEVTAVTQVTTVTSTGVGRVAPLLVTSVTDVTSATGPYDNIALAERAAIVEIDACLPRSWAEAYARLCLMSRPRHIVERRWSRIIDATGRLLDRWMTELSFFGWQLYEVFGMPPQRSADCFNGHGFLHLLGDSEVVQIASAHAVLANDSEGIRFHWKRPSHGPGWCLVWDLPAAELAR
jgi:hypothetical protein